MASKSEAGDKLNDFVQEIGIPEVLVTDNSGEQSGADWEKTRKFYLINQRFTEPYSPWQNRAEREIQETKKHFRRIMHRNRVPERLWTYGMQYTSDLRVHLALDSLNGRTPMEITCGDTPDISELLYFQFYQPVKYLDPAVKFPDDKEKLGRWLGIAHNIGQAMCYFVLAESGTPLARSTVRPLTPAELHDEADAIKAFDRSVAERLGEFSETRVLDIEPDSPVNPPVVTVTPDDPVPDPEPVTLHDPMINASVMLPHGDRHEFARVISRKRDSEGNLIGRRHAIPVLDSRIYLVQFPDGTEQEIAYNLLAEHLYSQCDSEGNQHQIFRAIINHRKHKTAVDKADQYRVVNGRRVMKRTLAGWDLEVEWKDGSTTWIPLKELKNQNDYDVATYAIANQIDSEPAFDWWVRHVITRHKRLIKASRRRFIRQGYKYGIKIPDTIDEAYALDRINGNTLWADAMQKEMTNVYVAFDVLAEGIAPPPPGYKKIPLRMIFDIKMDFTHKARLVAGGHRTDPPTTLTYSSVVSRDTVRLAFMIAALHDLDILMGDIGNAYLHAPTSEKVYAVAGPEFGHLKGRNVIIIRALYGLKSSGASWHRHFSEVLRSFGFTSCQADPDLWLRPRTKQNGFKYYEYVLVYVDDLICISENPSDLCLLSDVFRFHSKETTPLPPVTWELQLRNTLKANTPAGQCQHPNTC